MQVKEVDPYKVNVDEMNERTENLNLSDLEASIEEQGVIQPPIVRRRNGDSEVPYSVVVGQRRTLAAQGAGIDSMPVVIMNWDDSEALEASITENIDSFRENVSKKDRALAIERLKKMKKWTNKDVQKALGVTDRTVSEWLEPIQEEWEGTIIDAENVSNKLTTGSEEVTVDDIPQRAIKKVRKVTGGGERGEELLRKIAEHKLGKEDVDKLTAKVDRGREVDDALTQVIEEKHSTGGIKVNANVTFSGDHAGALTSLAKERGMTENEVVREAITDYLEREGYL